MSLETEGFLSAEADQIAAAQAASEAGWGSLVRDLNQTTQRLLIDTKLPFQNLLSDPPILSRMLLGRALSNFQGGVLLLERGMAVEARTLARACLETAFCLTAVLTQGSPFGMRLVADAEKHRRMLAKNLLAVSDAALPADEVARLQDLVASVPTDVVPHWLGADEMARASPIAGMYLFYRSLSGDAAHPSIGSLERYFRRDQDNAIRFVWGPEFDRDTVDDTAYLLCTFLITCAVAFNSDVAKSERISAELDRHWIALQAKVQRADDDHNAPAEPAP